MSAHIIAELGNRIAGQAILVNVHQGVAEGLIDAIRVSEFLSSAAERVAKRSTGGMLADADFLWQIWNTVWEQPSRFQLTGPACGLHNSRIVAFKSYLNIKPLVDEIDDTLSRQTLKDVTTKTYDNITDDECEEIARRLNELDPLRQTLFLSLKIKKGKHDNRFIAWVTRLEELDDLNLDMQADNDIATRLRNRLGLGHIKRRFPMFAFVSTVSYGELIKRSGHAASRPTVFDGIDQAWFKHRRDQSYPSDDWGRATDLEKVGRGVAGNLDGGPEAVSLSLPIPGNFSCVFVGRPRVSYPGPDQRFIDLLLNGPNLKAILDSLSAKFA